MAPGARRVANAGEQIESHNTPRKDRLGLRKAVALMQYVSCLNDYVIADDNAAAGHENKNDDVLLATLGQVEQKKKKLANDRSSELIFRKKPRNW